MTVKIGCVLHTDLLSQVLAPSDRARLAALGEVTWTDAPDILSAEEAIGVLADADVGLGSWDTPHPGSPGLLAACPKLRLWEHVAGSVRHMFGPHLEGRDLVIASCKPANSENVAAFTLAEIILALRGAFENMRATRRVPPGMDPETLKRWKPGLRRVVDGSTVGVVGASEVGRRVIALLLPFRARVLLYDPYVAAEEAAAMGAEKCDDLVDLCRRSHCVTLHAPLNASTKGLVGAEALAAMPDGAVLVNTARGAVLDEPALIRELETGRLRAVLDVTAPEPTDVEGPLRKLDNVVLTTHIAGPKAFNLGRQAVDDIERFLRGEPPLCVCTADMLDRVA